MTQLVDVFRRQGVERLYVGAPLSRLVRGRWDAEVVGDANRCFLFLSRLLQTLTCLLQMEYPGLMQHLRLWDRH